MSMMSNAALPRSSAVGGLLLTAMTTVKHGWVVFTAWREERTAIAQLRSMGDRELHDIGLVRSQIETAVKGGVDRERERCAITSL
jgi:uncharacterized protein YjiS (DUF1127 family)